MTTELNEWSKPTHQIEDIPTSVLDDAVKKLRKAKDEYSKASALSSEAHGEVKRCEAELIGLLERAGKKKYIVEGVGNVSISTSLSVTTPKTPEEKAAFFNWLRNEMGEDGYLTYATVNSNSLNSLYKEKVEEYGARGEVLEIDGLKQPTSYTKLSLRKA